ncbi:uncharacterized protein LOC132703528 [Cylas formicarius]|uniref:uncharacterized protein LOC132703528 n=1 Tax=Cylas formicarius TaxID=197179 RepID=UPI002958DA2B|nr:uncharacterized protein LOC132703528 [Cylas formicarius]
MNVTISCWVYALFLTFCGCQRYEDEGYTNDSPFISDARVETVRVKSGTPLLTIKCGNGARRATGLVWEYKPCRSYYSGLFCNSDVTDGDGRDATSWRKIHRGVRDKFEIARPNETHSGMYRCRENDLVKRTYLLEIVDDIKFDGPPPSISSLKISNATSDVNAEFTIQCNVSSVVPPTVIWFKSCFDHKCEIAYENVCYCHLNFPPSAYNVGNTYLSKINVHNTRSTDSGIYACLAVTEYGKDHKNVTVQVTSETRWIDDALFPILVCASVIFVVVSVLIISHYCKKKTKTASGEVGEQEQRLAAPGNDVNSLPTRNSTDKRR